jgi:transcription elongation factor Elf1
MKCLVCGSTALVSGTLFDNSSGGSPAFKLDDVSVWKSMFGVGTRKVRSYGCVHCGHLQLAVDFSKKDRERYQQFEGEQPGVLERLNNEETR